MKLHQLLLTFLISSLSTVAMARTSVLFIGNSFTYGWGSPVRHYRASTVTDLNNEGIGGVPALFKSFADQAGLDYDVYLETRGGAGIDFHLENKLAIIGRRPFDQVVMHGYSTLDAQDPGNPDKLSQHRRRNDGFSEKQKRSRRSVFDRHLVAGRSGVLAG